jgi:ligand-binding sensor domain-containing protein
LAHDRTYSIVVAQDGALWFGTWAGISRYDGKTWTTHTTEEGLAGNYTHAIAVDPVSGALWFSHFSGVAYLHDEG